MHMVIMYDNAVWHKQGYFLISRNDATGSYILPTSVYGVFEEYLTRVQDLLSLKGSVIWFELLLPLQSRGFPHTSSHRNYEVLGRQ